MNLKKHLIFYKKKTKGKTTHIKNLSKIKVSNKINLYIINIKI